MYCQMCGRSLYGRGNVPCCVGNGKSIVKRNDNAARSPMVIVGRSGPFQISQSQLGGIWPGGIQRAQERGNRILRANDIIGRPYASPRERDACYLALDWVKSRAVPLPLLTTSGYAQTSIFDRKAENLRQALHYGYQYQIDAAVQDLEDFFESLEKLFLPGQGIGGNVAPEVMDMGMETAPLVAEFPDKLYNLIRCMWTMTNYDTKTITRMIRAVSPQDHPSLQNVASGQVYIGGNTSFPVKVLSIMTGYPKSMVPNLVYSGVI